VKVRLREAENDALIRDLRARIQELEEVWNKQLLSHNVIDISLRWVGKCIFFKW
jgi:hypothetical protein